MMEGKGQNFYHQKINNLSNYEFHQIKGVSKPHLLSFFCVGQIEEFYLKNPPIMACNTKIFN